MSVIVLIYITSVDPYPKVSMISETQPQLITFSSCSHFLFSYISLFSLPGIPRDDCQRREVKQMKREGSPSPRGPGHPTDTLKSHSHESMVTTVKEGGRSIHLIPPEGVVIGKHKEGSITQVTGFVDVFLVR